MGFFTCLLIYLRFTVLYIFEWHAKLRTTLRTTNVVHPTSVASYVIRVRLDTRFIKDSLDYLTHVNFFVLIKYFFQLFSSFFSVSEIFWFENPSVLHMLFHSFGASESTCLMILSRKKIHLHCN